MGKKFLAAPIVAGLLFVLVGFVTLIGLMTFAGGCGTTAFNANAGRYVSGRCDSVAFMQRGIAVMIAILGILMIAFNSFGEWVKGFNLFAFMLGIVLVFSSTVISSNYNFRGHRLEVYEAFVGEIPPSFANATTEEEREFLAPQGWRPNPTGRFGYVQVARDGINANRHSFAPWPIDNRHVYRAFPPTILQDVPNPIADPTHPNFDATAPELINITIPTRIYASNPLADPSHPDFDENAPLVNHVNIHLVWNNSPCFDGQFRNFNTIMGFIIIALSAIYAVFMDKTNLSLKLSFKNTGLVFTVFGGLIIVGLQTFAQKCDLPIGQHGTMMPVFMRCADISSHIYAIAVTTIIAGLLMVIFGGSKGFGRAISIGVGMLGVWGVIINALAYTCATPTMPCNAGPFTPFIYIMSAFLAVAAIINILALSRKEEEADEEA